MKEQEIISAQQELKHLRTRCGKVYALGNNRFRAVVQTTPVHEYDAATHQWVELSAEKRQQMAAQAHSPIATFSDSANSAENAAGILDTYVKEGSTQNFSHDERLWISNTNYYGNLAGTTYSPALLANYAYDLAKEFNQFYHDFSILKEENEALRNFRLLLAKQCGEAIKNAMGMLGIEMPERM